MKEGRKGIRRQLEERGNETKKEMREIIMKEGSTDNNKKGRKEGKKRRK